MSERCLHLAMPVGRLPVVVVVILAAAGCSPVEKGPTRFAVRGQVMFDGKPVPKGRIAFEPDAAAGNMGPGGYGSIDNGTYATYPRMGAVGGPHLVRISGFDGVPSGEMIEGGPLFAEYTTTIDLPLNNTTVDFDIPKSPASQISPQSAPSTKR